MTFFLNESLKISSKPFVLELDEIPEYKFKGLNSSSDYFIFGNRYIFTTYKFLEPFDLILIASEEQKKMIIKPLNKKEDHI